MGYYHIELSPFSKSLYTIIPPWRKYEYHRLPMVLCNCPDIFREKMSSLFDDLEYVMTYIDDLLTISKGNCSEHLQQLDVVLQRIKDAGLKVNANKSFFGKPELEYLGYWITRIGIQPVTKKIQAILNINTPTTKQELHRFIGMVNYYRDMWAIRSDVLAPLTKLGSTTAKWLWTEEQQKSFETIKQENSKDTLLSYPDLI
jgi:Reverse transcriptase (RNA-dependent DNA polymerase)